MRDKKKPVRQSRGPFRAWQTVRVPSGVCKGNRRKCLSNVGSGKRGSRSSILTMGRKNQPYSRGKDMRHVG